MNTILLSIRPEYVKKILAGEKEYEYRRHLAKLDVHKMLIYCTSPVIRVVAVAEVCEKVADTPSSLWERTKKGAGITKRAFPSYLQGCSCANAYRLGKIKVFRQPKKLEDYGISFAPQSFVYIKSVPNSLTAETLSKSAHGKDIFRAKDADDLFRQLGV